jgi:hypothetical protein
MNGNSSPQEAMARRHVGEFEQRVERQKQLIAELERDGHTNMLASAHKLLTTLEDSLRIARNHLAIEIARNRE